MRFSLAPLVLRFVGVCTTVALVANAVVVRAYAGEPADVAVQVAAIGTTVENLQVSFSGGVVTISYDLPTSEAQSTFDVTLEVSINGGQTYDVKPRSMSGDVGRPVSTGRSKRIVWEFAKDVESLQTNQFRFRVVIRIESRSDAVAAPLAPPSAVSTQTPPASSGNRLWWPGLAMLGAGGALAAVAAAGPLRKRTDYLGYYELTPSKPAMYGGIGVAASGLVLMLLGRRGVSGAASIVLVPGGVVLYRSATF